MKKYCLITLLILGVILLGSQSAAAETIRMGYFEISPHMYTSKTTGLPAGKGSQAHSLLLAISA